MKRQQSGPEHTVYAVCPGHCHLGLGKTEASEMGGEKLICEVNNHADGCQPWPWLGGRPGKWK